MGWNQPFVRPNNIKSFLDDKYTTDNGVVLASEVVQSARNNQKKVYYAAWQNNQTKEVSAIITRIHDDEAGFSYQTQEETWCPDECCCPKSIFSLLTEAKNDNAALWRFSVNEFHKLRDSVLGIKVGQEIVFCESITANGMSLSKAKVSSKTYTDIVFQVESHKETSPFYAKVNKHLLFKMVERGIARILDINLEANSNSQIALF